MLRLLFKKDRTLRVDIVALFLSLICVAFAVSISFTYVKNSETILNFSKWAVKRVAAVVIQKLESVKQVSEMIPSVIAGTIQDEAEVSLDNKALVAGLLDEVKFCPFLTGIYVATEQGNLIGVSNIHLYAQTHYSSHASDLLPAEARFGLYSIDNAAPSPYQIWYYKDESFHTVASERIEFAPFDPRTRPWYVGAKEAGSLFWTNVYHYVPTHQPGISVARPFYDQHGQVIGAVGADLSLSFFSEFIAQQKVGKTGEVFIFNNEGKIVVPRETSLTPDGAVQQAFSQFTKAKQEKLVFTYDHIEYLAYFTTFPLIPENGWLIAVIVPINDFFEGMFAMQKEVALISLLILIISGMIVIYYAKKISSPIVQLAHEVDRIQKLDLDSETRVFSHIREVNQLDNSIAAMRLAMRSFGRYVPKEIVKQLFQKEKEIVLGGVKKEITVFFSDIRGFTQISESLPTEILMPQLSAYFDEVSKVILQCHGTIDKYIGDSVMAFWGAPSRLADHTIQACIAALYCKAVIDKFNSEQHCLHKEEFKTSMGIHTGMVIVGNIGTKERMNYTVIGDVVNTAARLQKLDREYEAGIIVSEEVKAKIEGHFALRPLDYAHVKGKKEKIHIYEVLGLTNKEFLHVHAEGSCLAGFDIMATPSQVALAKLFSEAYTHYTEGKTAEAKMLFEQALEQFPDDFPTKFYLKRL